MAEENIWKKLTRLFRSGPVVRHKIARAEPIVEPIGTARAYKQGISSLYMSTQASYGQYERLSRYADYHEMQFMPELASGLDIYADEICACDETGRILKIESPDPEVKEVLETFFYEIADIDFNLWSWVRNTCKNGDHVLFVDASETNGILNLLPIPINEIEREEGYDKEDPFAVRYKWVSQGNKVLENWQVIHFRLIGDDSCLPYGYSILEPARRIWRQLVLIEDAMLVYRIVRSPERRVFEVPVGSISPDEVDRHMQDFISKLKRNQIVDPNTGRVDLRYNPMSVDEDYFFAKRGDVGPTVTTLPGGQFTGDVDDVKYIQAKLFAALKIPRAYLGYDESVGSKATLAQEDVRFAKTIERIQKVVIAELNKIAIIHLYILGYRGDRLTDFKISMSTPSYIAEQQKLELWRMRFEVAGIAQEGTLDQDTVRRKIFGMNEAEIDEVREGMKRDRLFQRVLESIDSGGEGGGDTGLGPAGGGGGGDEPVPGSPLEDVPGGDQLPDTLGGEPKESRLLGGSILDESEDRGVRKRFKTDWDGRVFVTTGATRSRRGRIFRYGYWEDSLVPTGNKMDWRDQMSPRQAQWFPDDVIETWEPLDGDVLPDELLRFEAHNPGSTGDRAELAVDKGRNLFATHDSLFAHAFGTEKQTASDPYDLRSLRRMFTRPLSEDGDEVEEESDSEDGEDPFDKMAGDLEDLPPWPRDPE